MNAQDKGSLNINNLFLNYFNFNEKDDYNWKIVNTIKQEDKNDIEINLYFGKNKKEQNSIIFVKEIKFSFETNNYEIKKLLKEIYFLILLRKYEYFIKLDDMILFNESETKKRIYLIFKENNISLFDIINIYNKNEKGHNGNDKIIEDKSLLKYIIYQISFALYTLHSINIVHNNLKLENILINSNGRISICDLSSMSYKGEDSALCTLPYSSPEFLNNILIVRDEKFDMWALGVIILEVFLKTAEFFKKDEKNKEEIGYKKQIYNQLNNILTSFGITKNLTEKEINEILYNDSNENYKIQFTKEVEEKINDENILDLLNNLLVLNPNKRYSAEQVLKSPYLKEYSEFFNNIDLPEFNRIEKSMNYENDYRNYFNEEIDKTKFYIIFKVLESKLRN